MPQAARVRPAFLELTAHIRPLIARGRWRADRGRSGRIGRFGPVPSQDIIGCRAGPPVRSGFRECDDRRAGTRISDDKRTPIIIPQR